MPRLAAASAVAGTKWLVLQRRMGTRGASLLVASWCLLFRRPGVTVRERSAKHALPHESELYRLLYHIAASVASYSTTRRPLWRWLLLLLLLL